MRGGFQYDETPLRPALVRNEDQSLPREQMLHGVRLIATDILAGLILNSGHVFAADNQDHVTERLIRFCS